MVSFLGLTVLVLAAAPLCYYLLALYCVVDFYQTPAGSTAGKRENPIASNTPDLAALTPDLPAISILKPVCGVDRDAYENFASFCRLDYPKYELVFGAANPADPAIAIVRKLQQDFPERRIRLITPIPSVGNNRKVSVLCRLVEEAANELIVMSDSDVRAERNLLRHVAEAFRDEGIAGATCFYRSSAPDTLAGGLNSLGMAMESLPGALSARKLEGTARFAFGWMMATTKKHLAEIGGWRAMADHHSDDFELGNRLARAGYKVELLRQPVEMVFPEETLGEYLRHELRWSIGLRNVRPAAYWGLLLTHGLPWSIAAAASVRLLHWPKALATAYLVTYLVLRLGAAWVAGVWGLRDAAVRKNLWLAPLRDAISFAVWVAGCFRREIHWRGTAYRVKDRLLVPIGTARPAQQR